MNASGRWAVLLALAASVSDALRCPAAPRRALRTLRMASVQPMVPLRFVNTPNGRDVSTTARPGEILLDIADSVGVNIPRGCKSGLCGSCTCDLKDPTWTGGETRGSGGREGYQTIRACTTKVMLLPGQDEMEIDLFRMRDAKSSDTPGAAVKDPMARFAGDWETTFVPDYRAGGDAQEDEPHDVFDGADGVPPWENVW